MARSPWCHRTRALLLLPMLAACTRTLELGEALDEAGDAAAADGALGGGGAAPLPGGAGGQGGEGAAGGTTGERTGGRAGSTMSACTQAPTGARLHIRHRNDRPVMMVAVERSASMLAPLGGESRLEGVRKSLLSALQKHPVGTGLVIFPGTQQELCDGQTACCQAVLVTTPRLSSVSEAAINEGFRCRSFDPQSCFELRDDAPVAEALKLARLTLRSFDADENKRQLLLFVDGDPSCPGQDNPCDRARAEAGALVGDGVEVNIVGVGADAASSTCLQALGRDASASADRAAFTPAATATELGTTIEGILARTRQTLCTITLDRPPGVPERVQITFNDVPPAIRRDDSGAAGWRFVGEDDQRIEFNGQACLDLLRGAVRDIDVYEVCP